MYVSYFVLCFHISTRTGLHCGIFLMLLLLYLYIFISILCFLHITMWSSLCSIFINILVWNPCRTRPCWMSVIGIGLDCRSIAGAFPHSGGGICTYLKSNFIYEELTDQNISGPDLDLLVIENKNAECRNMLIIALDHPPFDNCLAAIEMMSNICKVLFNTSRRQDVVITGDLNINLLEDSPGRKLVLNLCEEFYLLILIFQLELLNILLLAYMYF